MIALNHSIMTLIGVAGLSLLSLVNLSEPIAAQVTIPSRRSITNLNPGSNLGGVGKVATNSKTTSSQESKRTVLTYVPPNRGAPKATLGAGSRGCVQSLPMSLRLLVPNDHIGLTTSGHPTFAWYVSEALVVPMEFALIEPGVPEPLFVTQVTANRKGTFAVKLPKSLAAIAANKQYRWSVSLICNPRRRSNDVYVQSWIERSPLVADLNQKLAASTSDLERAAVYAQAGFWYDALAAVHAAQISQPHNSEVVAAQHSLLEQGGLTELDK